VLNNTVDDTSSIAFAAPFSTWRVGQNKPPDAPNALDAFFIYQESIGATRLIITAAGRVGIGINNPVHPLHLGNGAYCTAAGVWTSVSDRESKTGFLPVEPSLVLSNLAALPISEWRYKVEADGVKHLGPTAQDFYSAFGLGESDRAIGAVDADGVALAAIKGLHQLVREKDAEIQELKSAVAELRQLINEAANKLRAQP